MDKSPVRAFAAGKLPARIAYEDLVIVEHGQPAALDEVDRKIMQLEIEREALKKEKDQASKERLAKIESQSRGCTTIPAVVVWPEN